MFSIGGFSPVSFGAGLMFGSAIAPVTGGLGFMVGGAAACVGNWGADYARFASNPRGYIDGILRRLGVGAPDRPAERKKLAQGTDSPDYGTRGASYIREKLGNGNALPTQSDVLNNIYGPPPKDEAARRRYDGAIEKDKEKDNVLRAVTEKIVGDWINDPRSRGEFARKWSTARTPAERAMALLDPRGDGAYMQQLSGFISGLQNGDDYDTYLRNWERVADWFASNVGENVIDSMGAETYSVASSLGLDSSTPVRDPSRYAGKLMERGYTNEEAYKIAGAFDSEEMADEAMRRLGRMEDGSQLRNIVEQKIPELKRKMEEAKEAGYKRQYRDRIDDLWNEYRAAQRKRADRFLQEYTKVLASRFRVSNDELGYRPGDLPPEVENIPTALAWIHDRLRRVRPEAPYVPLDERDRLPPAPQLPEIKDDADDKTKRGRGAGGGAHPVLKRIEFDGRVTPLETPKRIKGKDYKYELKGVDGKSYYCAEKDGGPDGTQCVDERGRKVLPVPKREETPVQDDSQEPASGMSREEIERKLQEKVVEDLRTNYSQNGRPIDGSYTLTVNDVGDGKTYNIYYTVEGGRITGIRVEPPL